MRSLAVVAVNEAGQRIESGTGRPEMTGRRMTVMARDAQALARGNGSGGKIRTYDQAINSRPLYH